MTRILYVWDADYPWDVRTEKVCRTLSASGHEVHIAARNRAWRPDSEVLPEGTVHRLPPWRWAGKRTDGLLSFPAFLSPRWLSHLKRIVRASAIELIIVRDLPLCPTAIWTGGKKGIPVVFDMAENYPALLQDVWDTNRQKAFDWVFRNPKAASRVENYCLPRVDRVLVVVEESRDRMRNLGVPSERVAIVSNTPPLARARAVDVSRLVSSGSRVELVYMGLMEIARGVGVLLEGFRRAAQRRPQLHLRLIGGGRDLPLLKSRAAELGLGESQLTMHGYIPSHADALELVARADIGMIPHYANEWATTTIPNKLFDYMAASLPVISSDSAPCKRILAETGAGVVFTDRNPDDLALRIEQLVDPESRRRMGAAGVSAIRSRYNWEKDSAVLLQTIGEVAAPRPPAR